MRKIDLYTFVQDRLIARASGAVEQGPSIKIKNIKNLSTIYT